MPDLRERVAIVTGAGRGIGRAYALRMAAYGARVVVNDAGVATDGGATDEDPAAEVVAEIIGRGRRGGRAPRRHRRRGGRQRVGRARARDVGPARHRRQQRGVRPAAHGLQPHRRRVGRRDPRPPARDVRRVAAACQHWRAQAKEHGTTYGRLINTATGLLLYGGAGQSNYVAAKAGINAFTEAVATEMAPYGVTVNAIMPGANTRLAQIGWRTARSIDAGGRHASRPRTCATRCTSPSSAASSRHRSAAGISGQTFQVHGGTIEHVSTWRVAQTWQRDDRGFTADELAAELPLDARPEGRRPPTRRVDRRPPTHQHNPPTAQLSPTPPSDGVIERPMRASTTPSDGVVGDVVVLAATGRGRRGGRRRWPGRRVAGPPRRRPAITSATSAVELVGTARRSGRRGCG